MTSDNDLLDPIALTFKGMPHDEPREIVGSFWFLCHRSLLSVSNPFAMMQKIILLLSTLTSRAFVIPQIGAVWRRPQILVRRAEENDVATELLSQAAKLRAEAEALEAAMNEERQEKLEMELSQFFESADANGDGVVSLEELKTALRKRLVDGNQNKRSAERLASQIQGEGLEKILQELDVNADGVLQREEMISVESFKDRLERNFRDQKKSSDGVSAKATVEAAVAERFAAFESIRNSTGAAARFGAFVAYCIPLIDGIPVELIQQSDPSASNPLAVLLVSAWVFYRSFPASGLLAFIALSAVASNAGAPRLVRFAARHAIILDIIAAVLIPLSERVAPPPFDLATALVFEALVLASALGAVFGKDADFLPGTGTLTKKFTDDYDDSIRSFIRASTTAELGAFVAEADDLLKTPTNTSSSSSSDDDDDAKNNDLRDDK